MLINWIGSKSVNKYLVYIFITFLGVTLGSLVSLYSVLPLIILAFLSISIWLISKPNNIPLLLLILSSLSLNLLLTFSIFGFDASTFYKLLIIIVMLFSIRYYGINLLNLLPVISLFMILVFSYTFSSFHPRMSMVDPFISFIGLVAPFTILLVKWKTPISNKIISIIPLLSIFSVVVGFILAQAGLHDFILEEYYGGKRLQGANIGPHLAMLAFLGMSISLIEIKRRPDKKMFFFFMAILNFLILLSTGTRGALISSIFIILVFIFNQLKEIMKGKIYVLVPIGIFVITVITLLITQWENLIVRSFNANAGSIGINLSGRDIAWKYFIENAVGSEIFGQGLGAVLVANDGSLYSGFTVPHNEYIRFYFDSGFIGAILIFISLGIILVNIVLCLPNNIRILFLSLTIGFFVFTFVDNTLSTIQFVVPFCFYLSAIKSFTIIERFELNTKDYSQL
ncbi:O-antigen ligase family protein [Metabacillus sp. SLBN-84]